MDRIPSAVIVTPVLRLHLANDGIGRAEREADIAEHNARNVSALQSVLEYGGLLPVLGQEGDCDAMHGLVLAKILLRLHGIGGQTSEPSDFCN